MGLIPCFLQTSEIEDFESFNGKMRYQFLNGEIFYTLKEAEILIEMWRKHYNQIRPHSSLNGRPPAPLTITVNEKQVA